MKRFFCFLAVPILLCFFSCSDNLDVPDDVFSLKAKIFNCSIAPPNNPNFEDANNNVYAYRADALFAVPAIQTGGHSTVDESTDLGVNFFFDPSTAQDPNQTYNIDSGSGSMNSAYVFYIINGDEYISDGVSGTLTVQKLDLELNGSVIRLRCSFNEVNVVNNADSNDQLCIKDFELVYND